MGTMNVLIANPRDIPGFIKTLQNYKVNMFPAVNTLFNGLANYPDFAKLDFSGLKVCMGGGMAVQQSTAEKWRKITGCAIAEGYGLSETSPVATVNRLDVQQFTGSIGLPIPNTEIAIRDDEGRDLPLGERGEICIRGPQVMAGYWNRPHETAAAIVHGRLRTGDIGTMDGDGYIFLIDRIKDLILVGGFNVYPRNVEEAIYEHAAVAEVTVIGVPDEYRGQAVKAFVRCKDGAKLDQAELMEFLRTRIGKHELPREIEFRHKKALWASEGLPFRAEFFHPGDLCQEPVRVNGFTLTHVQPSASSEAPQSRAKRSPRPPRRRQTRGPHPG